MYCEVCGKENSQFVAICSYCGGKLVEVKPLNPEPAYKKLENSIEKKKNELNNLEIDLNKEFLHMDLESIIGSQVVKENIIDLN